MVDHDAVLFQGVEAAAVELAGEQALGGAEGVGGIHDDQVVFLLAAADELEGVLKVDVHPAVVHAAGVAGQVGAAGLTTWGSTPPGRCAPPGRSGSAPAHAAVSGTDDQDILGLLVHGHGHMHDHLVVDELVALGQHRCRPA